MATIRVKPAKPISFEEFLIEQGVDAPAARDEFYEALGRQSDDHELPGRWKRLLIEATLHNPPKSEPSAPSA
jgi:hypothetical protein